MSTKASGAWTVLDTSFAHGDRLLQTAQAWMQDSGTKNRTDILHYVALCGVADLPLWRSAQPSVENISPLATELYAACKTALPGIQRMLLEGGRISLTLCAGPLQAMLSEQLFQADEVSLVLDTSSDSLTTLWDKWAIQLLARRCRRGTRLQCRVTGDYDGPNLTALKARLVAQGFVWAGVDRQTHSDIWPPAEYNPRWALQTTRTPVRPSTVATAGGRRCAIVGAGLAGASVAHALALRGWQVCVLDTAPEPAQGASGLPVGLVVPHVSVDDSPRSRLSRAGVRLTLAHAQRLLKQGVDWDATGAMERSADGPRVLAASPDLQTAGWLADDPNALGLWHPYAAWIKPASLIQAWMRHPGIGWMGSSEVARLERQGGTWALLDTHGKTLTTADTVVIANAAGACGLLQNLAPESAIGDALLSKLRLLQSLYGTVSHGVMPPLQHIDTSPFPPYPVNGSGSLIANIPTPQGTRWYAGATYETDGAVASNTQAQHRENFQRLHTLLPAAADALTGQFANNQVHVWTGTRCVSHDRLPLVGPVHADSHSGLWLSMAMGSRGLTFAALCAERLVAHLGAEPLPVEARLLRSLDAHRPLRRPTAPQPEI